MRPSPISCTRGSGRSRLQFGLEAICALLAIIATWLAVRASKRFEDILRHNAMLQEARADELEKFAQRVAHDLLSPMAAVTFTLGAIARHHSDPQTQSLVERAKKALERSRQMVHGIFNFARAGAQGRSGGHAPLEASIRAAVEDLLASNADSPPTVDVEKLPDCEVACDAAVLAVIVTNLLNNAVKYMSDVPTRRITIRGTRARDRVRIEVEDTGPGLPPGLEADLFEPYVRAPGVTQPGLGLGLATVKRLVTSHGGDVGTSRPPVGALFWFELPASSMPAADENRVEKHGGNDGASERLTH